MFTFDKAERRLTNMSEMMDRLGLDITLLAYGRPGMDLRSATHSCRYCRADDMCRDWLARMDQSIDRAPAFCPNAELFARMRAEQRIN